MPVMDGLELISEAKKRNQDLQVVILSNYDDFEYARQAVRLGAVQYMLKSEINEASLTQMLKNLTATGQSHPERANLRMRQEQYLNQYLLGLTVLEESASGIAPPEPGLFPEGRYLVVQCNGISGALTEESKESLLKNVESLIDSVLGNAIYSGGFYKERLLVTVVCPVSERDGACDPGKFREKCGQIVRNIKTYFDIDLHVGISPAADSSRFPELFHNAQCARLECFFTNGSVCEYSDALLPDRKKAPRINRARIQAYIESGGQDGLRAYISEIFDMLLSTRSFSDVRVAYIDLLSIAKTICESRNIDMTAGLSHVKFSYDNLILMPCLVNVRDYILDIYSALLGGDRYSYTIRHCMCYIEKHYADNITLDDLAQAVNISKSYLSMMFKQETGVNFIAYLTKYRLERAKELIIGSNLKIYEIAEKVGFSSPYYFSKVFKDETGMSCKEYKDHCAVAD